MHSKPYVSNLLPGEKQNSLTLVEPEGKIENQPYNLYHDKFSSLKQKIEGTFAAFDVAKFVKSAQALKSLHNPRQKGLFEKNAVETFAKMENIIEEGKLEGIDIDPKKKSDCLLLITKINQLTQLPFNVNVNINENASRIDNLNEYIGKIEQRLGVTSFSPNNLNSTQTGNVESRLINVESVSSDKNKIPSDKNKNEEKIPKNNPHCIL